MIREFYGELYQLSFLVPFFILDLSGSSWKGAVQISTARNLRCSRAEKENDHIRFVHPSSSCSTLWTAVSIQLTQQS